MTFDIYTLSSDDIVRYVGQSKDARKRVETHYQFPNGQPMREWLQDLAADGRKPEVDVIERCTSRKEALRREQYWIKFYNEMSPLLNFNGLKKNKKNASDRAIALTGSLNPADWKRFVQVAKENNKTITQLVTECLVNVTKKSTKANVGGTQPYVGDNSPQNNSNIANDLQNGGTCPNLPIYSKGKLSNRLSWGLWVYDPANLTLTYTSSEREYEIDLEGIITSDEVVSWFDHMTRKQWANVYDLYRLQDAFQYLCRKQIVLTRYPLEKVKKILRDYNLKPKPYSFVKWTPDKA